MLKMINSLVASETNLIANLANICAVIKEQTDLLWVGFYLVDGDELVLGPFQGPLACTRISFHAGVCGKAWREQKTQLINNVHEFSGHIACSTKTNSELVIPIIKNDKVVGVLDLDSEKLNAFTLDDQACFEEISQFIATLF